MKTTYNIDGTWFHGSTKFIVNQIVSHKIDTSLGGGELGKGFYIGNFGHVASAWARHKYQKDAAVAEIEVSNFSTSGLKKLELSWLSAKEQYITIGLKNEHRSFHFGSDVVAAPIVGRAIQCCPLQLKWEGGNSQAYLNSPVVLKKIGPI